MSLAVAGVMSAFLFANAAESLSSGEGKSRRRNKWRSTVTLNGEPIEDWKIRHADIVKGGELVFEMCDK